MSNVMDIETSELTVKNFGPIREATVELRPLTIFAGPTNTGKSYLATLIYALHRIFGGGMRYPTRQQKMPKNAARVLHGWLKGMPASPGTLNITNPVYRLLQPLFSGYDALFQDEVSRCFGANIVGLIRQPRRLPASIAIGGHAPQRANHAFKPEFVIDKRLEVIAKFPESAAFEVDDRPTVEFNDLRYPFGRRGKEVDASELDADGLLRSLLPVLIPSIFGVFSHRAFYLPANRAGIMRAHHVVADVLAERAARIGPGYLFGASDLPGASTDFLNVLVGLDDEARSKLFGRRSQELEDATDDLAKGFERDILGGSVMQRSVENGEPSILYHPEGWQGFLDLKKASSTVSELAPIVLYLRHVAQAGDVLIIEEPESHLHPSMQAALVCQLAAMVNWGIRVLVTTHSEWMLEALTNLVRLSDLPEEKREGITGADQALTPEQVGVWLFEPRNRPIGSVVKEARLDYESGLYDTKFDDVGIMLQNDWARINNRIEKA